MIQFFKRFFTDETAFIGLARGAIMAAGAAAASGQIPIPPEYGVGLMALSSAIRAGDKNKG